MICVFFLLSECLLHAFWLWKCLLRWQFHRTTTMCVMIHVWIKQIILIVFDIRLATWTPQKFNIITWYSNHNTYWNLKSTMILKYFWKCSYKLDVRNIQQVFYFEGNKTIWSDSIVEQYSHLQDKTFSKIKRHVDVCSRKHAHIIHHTSLAPPHMDSWCHYAMHLDMDPNGGQRQFAWDYVVDHKLT